MGRKKAPVLNTRAAPKPVEAAQATEAMETPSASFSSAGSSKFCSNCESSFQEMANTDFNNHVATCTRPSTAENDGSESSLSPPPESPGPDQAVAANQEDEDDFDADDHSVADFDEFADDVPVSRPTGSVIPADNANLEVLDEFRTQWQDAINSTSNENPKQTVVNEDNSTQHGTSEIPSQETSTNTRIARKSSQEVSTTNNQISEKSGKPSINTDVQSSEESTTKTQTREKSGKPSINTDVQSSEESTTNTQTREKSSKPAINTEVLDENEDDGDAWGIFEDFTIDAYVEGEFEDYEYEALRKGDKTEEADAEMNDDEGEALLDPEDPKVADELKVGDDEEVIDEAATPNNEVADDAPELIEDDVYNADTPTGVQTPQQQEAPEFNDLYDATPTRPSRGKMPAALATVEDDFETADTPIPVSAPEVANVVDGVETPKLMESTSSSQVEGADTLPTSEALKDALSKAADLVEPTPYINEVGDIAEQTAGRDVPEPLQVTAEKPVTSEASSQIAEEAEEKRKTVIFKYKKLTPMSEFADFLKDPGTQPYDELYRRAAITANILAEYQKERNEVDDKLYDYEQRKAHLQALADEKKKELADQRKAEAKKAQQEEDKLLTEMQKQFEPQLKLKGQPWNDFLAIFDKHLASANHANAEVVIRRIKNLHDATFVIALTKRQKAAEKDAVPKIPLVNGDLPPLNKKDLEPHVKERKLYMDPVKFDEMKQADVYGQNYSAMRSGNQKLVNRNTLIAQDDEQNENGRPRREPRGLKRKYNTSQSGSAAETEAEELPEKRQRTARKMNGDEGDASPSRPKASVDSRGATPVPKSGYFSSGVKIGRPPGAKTGVGAKGPKRGGRAPKSSLKNELAVSPSPSEADDEAKPKKGKNKKIGHQHHGQDLEDLEEDELQAAASTVAETRPMGQEVEEPLPAPIKKKHAGGRPKKNVAAQELTAGPSGAPAEEVDIQPKPRNKGGRPRKNAAAKKTTSKRGGKRAGSGRKTAAARAAAQIAEEDEVLQSTEHDNESQFQSAVSSRPTTSSSGGTDATYGGGRPTRKAKAAATSNFTLSKTPNVEGELGVPGPSVSTNGRGKRKRAANDTIQPAQLAMSGDSEGENIVVDTYALEQPSPAAAKKRKVSGKKANASKDESTPEDAGEAVTTTTTRRPQRKIVPTLPESSIDPDQLGEYLSDDDGETPPPPPKRKGAKGGRGGGRKPKYKREQTTDIDTGMESSAPPSKKRSARAPKKKNVKQDDFTDDELSGDDSAPPPAKSRKSRTNTLIDADGAGYEASGSGMMDNGDGSSAPAKKRKAGAISQTAADYADTIDEGVATKKRVTASGAARKVSSNKGKGKVTALEESVEPEFHPYNMGQGDASPAQYGNDDDDDFEMGDQEPVAKPAKKRGGRPAKKVAPVDITEDDEDSADYAGMDPAEAALLRKKKMKSKKLAAATKARWAAGQMKGPMEKRKKTNAEKRRARLEAIAAKSGGGIVYADGTYLPGVNSSREEGVAMGMSATPAVASSSGGNGNDHVSGGQPIQPFGWGLPQPAPVAKKPKVTPPPLAIAPAPVPTPAPVAAPVPAPTTASTAPASAPAADGAGIRKSFRKPKPTPRSLGYDGAGDMSDEEFEDTPTEYERYQALASPKGFDLGKRARKTFVDLSALHDADDDSL